MGKELYAFYKERGICVSCGQEYAEPKKTRCFECAGNYIKQARNYRKNLTAEKREKIAAYKKDRDKRHKEQGLCIRCGKQKAIKGLTRCVECKVKDFIWYERKRQSNGHIPRTECRSFGLCHVCGKPAEIGKLCEIHYKIACRNLETARMCRNLENHPWKKDNDIAFKNFSEMGGEAKRCIEGAETAARI